MKTKDLKGIMKLVRHQKIQSSSACLIQVDGVFRPIEQVNMVIDEKDGTKHICFITGEVPEMPKSMINLTFKQRNKIRLRKLIMSAKASALRAIDSAFGSIKGD